jgi:L-cysteine S-thiosulfotransferase
MRGRAAHGPTLFVAAVLAVALFAGAGASAQALPGQALAFDRSKGNPDADFKAFRDYFTKRFPSVPLNDFVNGPYSMDAKLRKRCTAEPPL